MGLPAPEEREGRRRVDPAVIVGTPALGVFVADLLREFPSIAEDPKRSPWSVTPVPTDRFLELNFSSRVDDADVLRVFALASQRGLVVYDPDGPAMYLPGREDPVL